MQVVRSAALSRLRCVLGDFHIHTFTDILVQNFLLVFCFCLTMSKCNRC